jgi:hypothetical protein
MVTVLEQAVNKRETLVVNEKTFTIEHTVERTRSRTSPHEFALQYARGKAPSMYKDEERDVTNVFLNLRLVGTVHKAPNGMFVCRQFAHRDRNKVIEMLTASIR